MNIDKLKYSKDIGLINPSMIAGWPGMGNVALGVVDYLQRKLRAAKFAEIEIDPMSVIDSVSVENGIASFGPAPKNVFYYTKNPDIIIFKGEAQLPGQDGILLLEEVLDLASKLKVKRIYTGAAFPVPVSHKEPSRVYSAVNKRSLKAPLARFGLLPMENGHIAGLNGLLLGFAEKKGMEAACLLATMPQYAISLPNPRATAAIIEALRRILGFEPDMAELNECIKDMDEKMMVIEDKMKDVMSVETKEASAQPLSSGKILPPYIKVRIEKLFAEAAGDKAKAILLKSELDRWDLFKTYEDRFLDLFK